MPRFEPVDHDPFAAPRVAFMPVDNDPFMTSPEDAFAYGKGISPDATWRNLLPAAELGLSMAPGSGEAMSARDAWDASGRAAGALSEGNLGEAASEYLNMGTGLLGAIPGAGIVARGTKRGAAWMDRNLPEGFNRLLDAVYPSDPRSTTNIFAGPTAKTADHAALAKAQEMARQPTYKLSPVVYDDMPEGMKIFEIRTPDSVETGFINGVVDPNDPTNFIISSIAAPGSSNSIGHGGMMDIFRQLKATHPELETVSGTRLTGARQQAGVPVGQSKMKMRLPAAERRATPPWHTQDVPDDQQIVRFR